MDFKGSTPLRFAGVLFTVPMAFSTVSTVACSFSSCMFGVDFVWCRIHISSVLVSGNGVQPGVASWLTASIPRISGERVSKPSSALIVGVYDDMAKLKMFCPVSS